jgi:solute carrier family 35, member E3
MASEIGSTRTDRSGSFASSHTETGTLEEREKLVKFDMADDEVDRLKSKDVEAGEKGDELLPKVNEKVEPEKGLGTAVIWMVVNTLATIGIVSSLCPPSTRFPIPRIGMTDHPPTGVHE